MRKANVFLAAALLGFGVGAYAHNTGNAGNGNGGCGVGQQTNGCGSSAPTDPGAGTVNNGGAGGQGGAGGAGGTGIGLGVGVGLGGNATNSGVNNSTTVQGDSYDYRQAQTAYAAPLAVGQGVCMGSSSAGGQGVTFGVSFATTWTDQGCEARYDAQALNALGLRDAAIARLCQRDGIKTAIEASGGKCPAVDTKAPAKAAFARPAAGNVPS